MLLITLLELRMVAGRSQMRAGRPHAISGRPMLIHTCHAMLRYAIGLKSYFQNGMVVAWHGHSMGCVNQTRLYCVNQMGKTQSKPLAAWHGRRMAWDRHGMYELALTGLFRLLSDFSLHFCILNRHCKCLKQLSKNASINYD
jgi:hypothetical protein